MKAKNAIDSQLKGIDVRRRMLINDDSNFWSQEDALFHNFLATVQLLLFSSYNNYITANIIIFLLFILQIKVQQLKCTITQSELYYYTKKNNNKSPTLQNRSKITINKLHGEYEKANRRRKHFNEKSNFSLEGRQ